MYSCKVCGNSFSDLMSLARHVRDIHPKKKILSIETDTSLPPDRKLLGETSDMLIEDLRKEYLVRRYINLINDMENPKSQQPQQPQQLQPDTSKFKDLLELFKVLKEGKSDLTLQDALTQIKTLREIESEIEPREPESFESEMLKEGIKAFVSRPQQPQPLPLPQPQIPTTIGYEGIEPPKETSLGEIVSDLLTDKTKQMIKITPKKIAYSKIKDYINLTEEEFSEVYEKIKKG